MGRIVLEKMTLSAFLLLQVTLSACGIIREKTDPADTMTGINVKEVTQKPLTPEQSQELLGEVGNNWLYGQGVGETTLMVGTSIVFPPYAIWVLGNAALDVSGYEPLRISDALPEEQGKVWKETYDSVTSGPGRVSASIAGEEFRTQEVAKERIERVLEKGDAAADSSSQTGKVK